MLHDTLIYIIVILTFYHINNIYTAIPQHKNAKVLYSASKYFTKEETIISLSHTHTHTNCQNTETCQFYGSCAIQKLRRVHLFAETEHVSLSHLQLAQSMREEAKKAEEFREKQRDMRKKVDCSLPLQCSPPPATHSAANWMQSCHFRSSNKWTLSTNGSLHSLRKR